MFLDCIWQQKCLFQWNQIIIYQSIHSNLLSALYTYPTNLTTLLLSRSTENRIKRRPKRSIRVISCVNTNHRRLQTLRRVYRRYSSYIHHIFYENTEHRHWTFTHPATGVPTLFFSVNSTRGYQSNQKPNSLRRFIIVWSEPCQKGKPFHSFFCDEKRITRRDVSISSFPDKGCKTCRKLLAMTMPLRRPSLPSGACRT